MNPLSRKLQLDLRLLCRLILQALQYVSYTTHGKCFAHYNICYPTHVKALHITILHLFYAGKHFVHYNTIAFQKKNVIFCLFLPHNFLS